MHRSTQSAHRCQYSGCAHCSAFFYGVWQHTLKRRYRELCVEGESIVLGEEESCAPARIHEWDSRGEHGEVAGTGDEFEEGERLEIATEGKQIVLNL